MLLAWLAIVSATFRPAEIVTVSKAQLCQGSISPMQYGQFIEYLCDLVPGMWADKLCDGNFEGLTPYKFDFVKQTDDKRCPWYPSGAVNRAEYALDRESPVNGDTCQRITVAGGAKCVVGISQDGIAVDPADPCRLSIWLREAGIASPIRVRLHEGGAILAQGVFTAQDGWGRFETTLIPKRRSFRATLSIDFTGPGALWLDAASLMPTRTVGGWRPDVVSALRRLRPGVIRLGGSVMDDPNLGSFEWKETIGDPDLRWPFRAWGGLQPTGAGIEEFVQLCRAVKAEPLICVRVREKQPIDAAEEVEYFNGAATTTMGRLRAISGHPKPYKVRYWQVGNEQGGPEYERILPAFCRAMRAVDPSIKILSSFPSDGVIASAGPLLNFVCPHHYDCENLPEENDDFAAIRAEIAKLSPNHAIKVGVTEWNTTAGDRGLRRARLWTLENALACARYQNLMHRNCDLVEIANRSNLTNSFCSGILQTDNHRLYETPTYYAQMLYSNLAGTTPLRIAPPAPLRAGLDISATLTRNKNQIVLCVVNDSLDSVSKKLDLSAFGRLAPNVEAWTLADREKAGEPDATNSFENSYRIAPRKQKLALRAQRMVYEFQPLSITVLRFTIDHRNRIARLSLFRKQI